MRNRLQRSITNAKLQSERGNKTAGLRARRASFELEPMLKRLRNLLLKLLSIPFLRTYHLGFGWGGYKNTQ